MRPTAHTGPEPEPPPKSEEPHKPQYEAPEKGTVPLGD